MAEQDSRKYELMADSADADERLDVVMSEHLSELSRSRIQKLIEGGQVLINGETIQTKKHKVREGDEIEVVLPPEEVLGISAENIPISVVFEDDDLLVVNKPKGMVVHPAPGNLSGTLVNAVLYHCQDRLSSINGVIRPGIVHRIDKDTSGLLVIAKNDETHRFLSQKFATHDVQREYRAIVYNNFVEDTGTVNATIGRDPKNRLRQAAGLQGGREAVTHYRVLERFGKFTYLALNLETGRTHQIRVHMAHINHPLAGDPLYGPKKHALGAETQLLHAKTLGFVHPKTGEEMLFESPLPDGFEKALERLRKNRF